MLGSLAEITSPMTLLAFFSTTDSLLINSNFLPFESNVTNIFNTAKSSLIVWEYLEFELKVYFHRRLK